MQFPKQPHQQKFRVAQPRPQLYCFSSCMSLFLAALFGEQYNALISQVLSSLFNQYIEP